MHLCTCLQATSKRTTCNKTINVAVKFAEFKSRRIQRVGIWEILQKVRRTRIADLDNKQASKYLYALHFIKQRCWQLLN